MGIRNIQIIILLVTVYCRRVFGQEELKCFQCSGIPECGIKPEENFLNYCKENIESQACFEVVKDDSTMVRGCKSDLIYIECKNAGANCIECNASGCNNLLTTLKKPEISCHKCNSKKDPSCIWTRHDEHDDICKKLLPKYIKEMCYTKKLKDGTFKRGCTQDDNLCIEENESNCLICEENGCNKDFVRAQECIQLIEEIIENNEDDEDIEDLSKESISSSIEILKNNINYKKKLMSGRNTHQKSLCSAGKQYYDNRGCYVMRKDSNLIWGCAIDLQPEILKLCKENNKTCNYCVDTDCDYMKAPDPNNATNRITTTLTGVLTVIAFLHYFYS